MNTDIATRQYAVMVTIIVYVRYSFQSNNGEHGVYVHVPFILYLCVI